MIVISFIIAVYNAQEYIEDCIKSCLNMTDVPSEIIVINDGSTDNTPTICNKLKDKHKNITVIHQMNKGVSAARNVGLYNAKGEWLLFVDADDTVNADELKEVLTCLNKQSVDIKICTFGSNFIFKKSYEIHHVEDTTYHTEEFLNTALFQLATWHYLFHRKFILKNQITFPEGVICSEDQNFNIKALCCTQLIAAYNRIVYNYNCINPNSASKKKHSADWLKSRLRSANNLLIFCKRKSIPTILIQNQIKRMYESYMLDKTTNVKYMEKNIFSEMNIKKLPSCYQHLRKYGNFDFLIAISL